MRFPALVLSAIVLASTVIPAQADQHYSQEVVFDNSLSPGYYTYASGTQSTPSTLKLIDGHLPIETAEYISGPNALELSWQSQPNGGWDAEISAILFRNRHIDWAGDSLFVWLWTPNRITANALPQIAFTDLDEGRTLPLPLSKFTAAVEPHHWTRIRIPLAAFQSNNVKPFNLRHLHTIVFSQSATDGFPHTLYIDDVRIEPATQATHAPTAPAFLEAKAYERHIDLTWKPSPASKLDLTTAQYVIYRSLDGGPLKAIGIQRPGVNRYADYLGDPNASATYQVSARTSALAESAKSNPASAKTHPMTDDELLTMVQKANFRYYWEASEPISGMTLESQPGQDDVIATGATGFGIMAIVVGIDRGFITRAQGAQRLLQITNFLARADRFHGVWPHFISGKTGRAVALFQIYDDGADLVETSFLMQGLLTARQYFSRDDPAERQVRDQVNTLWHTVEWDWFRATPRHDALYWHWSPNYAFHIAFRLEGWNETMITYLLAIASPTHAVPASLYATGYTHKDAGPASPGLTDESGAVYGIRHTYFGIPLEQGYVKGSPGPLFFTQYSYLGYDPRGVRDNFTNYFRNNRNESLMSQAYSVANPGHFKGYGADSWGLTVADGPDDRYHEYKPFAEDDGTIAPTGAVSAYAYTPQQSLAAIKHWYRDLGAQVWSIYGFRDAFNQQQNWYSPITMGLNQAPQTVMIENGRTGLIWKTFMSSPEIKPMQKAIGLVPDID